MHIYCLLGLAKMGSSEILFLVLLFFSFCLFCLLFFLILVDTISQVGRGLTIYTLCQLLGHVLWRAAGVNNELAWTCAFFLPQWPFIELRAMWLFLGSSVWTGFYPFLLLLFLKQMYNLQARICLLGFSQIQRTGNKIGGHRWELLPWKRWPHHTWQTLCGKGPGGCNRLRETLWSSKLPNG